MYSLLFYKENHIQTIQYTKNINGTPSLVEAVSTIQNVQGITKYNLYHVRVQMLTEVKGQKIMKNYRQKQGYEAMEPSKRKIFLEKKQVRDMTNKHELKMKQLKYGPGHTKRAWTTYFFHF